MYLPNNPMYRRGLEQVADAFLPVWGITGRLVLDIQESEILWEGVPVYQQAAQTDGLAWQLYKDGLRRLTLLPGVESEEIIRFLACAELACACSRPMRATICSRCSGKQEFVLISYTFIEVMGEGIEFLQESPNAGAGGGTAARHAQEVATAKDAPTGPVLEGGAPEGLVDLSDYDATPYFLDEAEIRLIQSELVEEYRATSATPPSMRCSTFSRRSAIRRSATKSLDLLEDDPARAARHGRIPRGGACPAGAAHHRQLARDQLDAGAAGRRPLVRGPACRSPTSWSSSSASSRIRRPAHREEDIGEVLRELKPAALPLVLAHLGRTIDPAVRRALEPSVEALVAAQPQKPGDAAGEVATAK